MLVLKTKVVQDSVVGVRQRWIVGLGFVVDLDGWLGGRVSEVNGRRGVEVIVRRVVDWSFDAFHNGEFGRWRLVSVGCRS